MAAANSAVLGAALSSTDGDEDLGRRLQSPPDQIFDLLGRVRLGVGLATDELHEVGVGALPVDRVVLVPALGVGRLSVKRRQVHEWTAREVDGRADQRQVRDPRGVL